MEKQIVDSAGDDTGAPAKELISYCSRMSLYLYFSALPDLKLQVGLRLMDIVGEVL